MLPCSPFDAKELEARTKIIKKYAGGKYAFGLELVGSWKEFFDPSSVKKAKENLAQVLKKTGQKMYFSLHAPINKKNPEKNLFGPKNKNNLFELEHICKVSEDLGALLINFHASAIYSYTNLLKSGSDIVALIEEQIKKTALDLGKIDFEGVFTVENITGYCDIESLEVRNLADFKKMNFEVGFVDLKDFEKLNKLQPKAFAAVDICHLSATCDSSETAGKMKEIAHLIRHIHFNDSLTVWRPLMPELEGGLVPGEGELGERAFKEDIVPFIKQISKKQDVNVVIEVLHEDFIKSENSKKTLKKLLAWLDPDK